jgi:acyl-CoA thioester hydrolase
MKEYLYRLDFKVRDYELDIEGIVNNAVYQNYLEHTRHEFLLSRGISFADYAQQGIHMMIVRSELEYKYPLRSKDSFWVGLNIVLESKVRLTFEQDIYLCPDDRLVLKARITGTGLNENGRPKLPDEILAQLGLKNA